MNNEQKNLSRIKDSDINCSNLGQTKEQNLDSSQKSSKIQSCNKFKKLKRVTNKLTTTKRCGVMSNKSRIALTDISSNSLHKNRHKTRNRIFKESRLCNGNREQSTSKKGSTVKKRKIIKSKVINIQEDTSVTTNTNHDHFCYKSESKITDAGNLVSNKDQNSWLFHVGSECHQKSFNKYNHDENVTICVQSKLHNVEKWNASDFCIGSILGRGKFGCVYQATEKLSSGSLSTKRLALKVFTKKKVLSCQVAPHLLQREIEIHSRLSHKNILRMIGYFHDKISIYVVLEEAMKGDLFKNFMNKKHNKCLKEDVAVRYIYQVAQALSYLQRNNISHRDIKPENLLLASDDTIKICDFGWAVDYKDNSIRNTLCGTPEYVPPEMIVFNSSGVVQSRTYDAKYVDIWALGVLTYELIRGKTMFCSTGKKKFSMEKHDIFTKISSFCDDSFTSTDFQKCDVLFFQFVKDLVKKNPTSRLNINEILMHEWFSKKGLL